MFTDFSKIEVNTILRQNLRKQYQKAYTNNLYIIANQNFVLYDVIFFCRKKNINQTVEFILRVKSNGYNFV